MVFHLGQSWGKKCPPIRTLWTLGKEIGYLSFWTNMRVRTYILDEAVFFCKLLSKNMYITPECFFSREHRKQGAHHVWRKYKRHGQDTLASTSQSRQATVFSNAKVMKDSSMGATNTPRWQRQLLQTMEGAVCHGQVSCHGRIVTSGQLLLNPWH